MRDTRGRPVAPDRDEKVKATKSGKESSDGNKEKSVQSADHEDRLQNIEKILGIAKKADGMKGEDRGKRR